jgi:hypothetical protein
LLFTLPEFLVPRLNERRYSEVCDEKADYLPYGYLACGNVKLLEGKSFTHFVVVLVELDVMAAIGKVWIYGRGDVLKTDFGLIIA